MRNLVIILGDQLNDDSAVYDGFEPNKDAVWMAEVSATAPTAAMRDYERSQTSRGRCVVYRRLDDRTNSRSLGKELQRSILRLKPKGLLVAEPSDGRERAELERAARECGLELEIRGVAQPGLKPS